MKDHRKVSYEVSFAAWEGWDGGHVMGIYNIKRAAVAYAKKFCPSRGVSGIRCDRVVVWRKSIKSKEKVSTTTS